MKNTKELNTLLAAVAVTKQKAFNLHWNVRGDEFYSIHKLTDDLYSGLVEKFDEIAEKIAMGGEVPLSTYKDYLAASSIKEIAPKAFTKTEVCEIVVADLTTIIDLATKVPSSPTVQPLLDEIYMFADKSRWLFRSQLKK